MALWDYQLERNTFNLPSTYVKQVEAFNTYVTNIQHARITLNQSRHLLYMTNYVDFFDKNSAPFDCKW